MLFDQNVVTWPNFDILLSFHGNQLFCNIWNTFEMKSRFSPTSGFWHFKGTVPILDQKLCAIEGFQRVYLYRFFNTKSESEKKNFVTKSWISRERHVFFVDLSSVVGGLDWCWFFIVFVGDVIFQFVAS